MSRTRLLLLILIALVIALAVWIHRLNSGPPAVVFAPVIRETLVSTLTTNGKVEPAEWVAVRAERPGIIHRVEAQLGDQVDKGQLLVELDTRDAQAEVASAEAAVTQAKANLETARQGGTAAQKVEIRNAIARDEADLAVAQHDYESLSRLAEKQAATQQQVAEASQKVQQLQDDIQALERKQGALVGTADLATADARLEEARATLQQARARLERSRIRAPIAGMVYDLPARAGAYVNVGDLVADVGRLHQLKVTMYIDEPDMGRVAVGMPVTVTWDARPGRQWKCSVERMPTQIVTLGTRHVGEAFCTIDNPDLALVPGTSVNIEITSQVVANGLTIPKEAIRSENGQVGVYLLRGDRLEWRPVKLGASSVTRAAVASGLAEGDLVAIRSEAALKSGEQVKVEKQ